MHQSHVPSTIQRELQSAREHLASLINAGSVDTAERAWVDLLTTCAKVWNKLRFHAKQRNQSHVLAPFNGELANDHVLSYALHARNEDNHHGLEPQVRLRPGSRSYMVGGPGESVYIGSMRTDASGAIVEYTGSHPVIAHVAPARPMLVPVRDSGIAYVLPLEYKGQPLVHDARVVGPIVHDFTTRFAAAVLGSAERE